MKLRRLANRLRYRCGRCFANFNHPHPTQEDRACRVRHEDAEGAQRAQCPNSSAPALQECQMRPASHARRDATPFDIRTQLCHTYCPIVKARSPPLSYHRIYINAVVRTGAVEMTTQSTSLSRQTIPTISHLTYHRITSSTITQSQ